MYFVRGGRLGDGGLTIWQRNIIVCLVGRLVHCLGIGSILWLLGDFVLFLLDCFCQDGNALPFPYIFSEHDSQLCCPGLRIQELQVSQTYWCLLHRGCSSTSSHVKEGRVEGCMLGVRTGSSFGTHWVGCVLAARGVGNGCFLVGFGAV